MRKLLITALFLNSLAHADIKTTLYHLYQNKQYDQACKKALNAFKANRNDEEFVSLYAFSCLKADNIDRLAIPVSILKNSEEARSNAAYFSVILMQKKLLLHSLVDGYRLSDFKLPTTDHVISVVFDLYTKVSHERKRNHYIFIDPKNDKITYKLYLKNNNKRQNMIIEEYYDTIMTHRHIYW